MKTINELQDEVIEEFSDFDDWMDKYQQYLAGWLYLQGTDLPEDTAWKGDRRSFACG